MGGCVWAGIGKVSQFKLVLLGQAAVGKSSLVLRFVKNEFQEYQESTIGAAFCTKTLNLEDSSAVIKFEIWDTAGQERYESLAPMYYRGAHAAVVVFDITDAESFDKAQKWIRDLNRQANQNIVICLVGNKIDRDDERVVSTDQAAGYAEENDLLYVEASAKSGTNVTEVFQAIAAKLPTAPKEPAPSGVVEHLDEDPSAGQKKGCGCVVM